MVRIAHGDEAALRLFTAPTYSPVDTLAKASKIAIAQAVLALPEKQKLSIVLTCWEGLSVQETAKVLGVTLKSVESHLTRARKALRSALSDDGDQNNTLRKTA